MTDGERWEYYSIYVVWDTASRNWVYNFADIGRIEGMSHILDAAGQRGWELVSAAPERWDSSYVERDFIGYSAPRMGSLNMTRTTEWDVRAYRCFFKKRL